MPHPTETVRLSELSEVVFDSLTVLGCREVNGCSHDMRRALLEAADLNTFFTAKPPLRRRLLGRTTSFCTARSGHADNYDQGLVYVLPNAT